MILRAARLGTKSFHTKTTTGRRIGPTGPCSGETIEDSTFARFSEFFDFRFLQHYLPGTDLRNLRTDAKPKHQKNNGKNQFDQHQKNEEWMRWSDLEIG